MRCALYRTAEDGGGLIYVISPTASTGSGILMSWWKLSNLVHVPSTENSFSCDLFPSLAKWSARNLISSCVLHPRVDAFRDHFERKAPSLSEDPKWKMLFLRLGRASFKLFWLDLFDLSFEERLLRLSPRWAAFLEDVLSADFEWPLSHLSHEAMGAECFTDNKDLLFDCSLCSSHKHCFWLCVNTDSEPPFGGPLRCDKQCSRFELFSLHSLSKLKNCFLANEPLLRAVRPHFEQNVFSSLFAWCRISIEHDLLSLSKLNCSQHPLRCSMWPYRLFTTDSGAVGDGVFNGLALVTWVDIIAGTLLITSWRSEGFESWRLDFVVRRSLCDSLYFGSSTPHPMTTLSEPPLPFPPVPFSPSSSSSSSRLPSLAQQSMQMFSQLLVSHCVSKISNFRISDSSMLAFARKFVSDIITGMKMRMSNVWCLISLSARHNANEPIRFCKGIIESNSIRRPEALGRDLRRISCRVVIACHSRSVVKVCA